MIKRFPNVKGTIIKTIPDFKIFIPIQKQVRLFWNENKALKFFLNIPSTPGVTTTPPHPKYQNDNIDNNQIKISKFDLPES